MPRNPILERMLDRLYLTLMKGPSLNCRPHNSRQRVDFTTLSRFDHTPPAQVLRGLLDQANGRSSRLVAKVPMPPELSRNPFATTGADGPPVDEDDPTIKAWRAQKSLVNKLRNLGDDARTYEQDTGVHALYLGYPVLSVPPGGVSGGSRRILAPVAMIAVTMQVFAGRKPGIELKCSGEGIDLVVPNAALMAWLERETGEAPGEMFEDEEAENPWREIGQLIEYVSRVLEITPADQFASFVADPLQLDPLPLADDLPAGATILPGAVLGLFPVAKQGLLRDTRDMLDDDHLEGPVESFIDVDVDLDAVPDHEDETSPELPAVASERRQFADERLVALADPCQAQAVKLARQATGLVVHGPPGTGKSQTIANIIGDHLARGQRVLFVCEKRTALDVVANRLEHLGLDGLAAVVHDPKRDQRNLYMAIRKRLDDLDHINTHPRAAARLEKIDAELQSLHEKLTVCHDTLMLAGDSGYSFHDLVGQWLNIQTPSPEVSSHSSLRDLAIPELEQHRQDIEVALDRAAAVEYPTNPWTKAAGSSFDAFLARPMDEMRRALASSVEDARATDATADDRIPPFDPDRDLELQVTQREEIADRLEWIGGHVDEHICGRVAGLDAEKVPKQSDQLHDVELYRRALSEGGLDAELRLATKHDVPRIAQLNLDIAALQRYLQHARAWWGFLAFKARSAAAAVAARYGLLREPEPCERLVKFLKGLRARIVLSELHRELTGRGQPDELVDDDVLTTDLDHFQKLLDLRSLADKSATLTERVTSALVDGDRRVDLLFGLRRSRPRAGALATMEAGLVAMDLFDPRWLRRLAAVLREGGKATAIFTRLEQHVDSIESVLRVRDALAALPEGFSQCAQILIQEAIDGAGGIHAIRKGVLAAEIGRRIAGDPNLQRLDGQQLQNSFDRYRELENRKRELVRDAIEHQWVSRQQQRLLVGTGSRLNSEGADLRRRLFVRGRRAMRLRQVIAVGEKIEGGDPLFDMNPVWMASPETVAQIFPRRPLFDVVIFDEASQCRLEDALPVLTRGQRVVIAGDPKQLPPTRFFEAAITTSEDDALETDQDLFEAQQQEVEDLLCGALNLQVHESYLDVHYRSRNADLIGFSNQYFYNSRLQPIPGHPAHRADYSPITLHRADGVYDQRCNPIEAQRVCEIVRDLLRRAEPPSIGIACFNLKQRDLIAETLDDMAGEDDDFARRLARSRERRGEGSFEGLFVRNLESVQGDERDHIIISTTYGPNPEGRFYRRFGPLGLAGGGRRLNVLVTRARHEVHLVSSIPPESYRSLEAVPQGQSPNGAWLLFAYLHFAEKLETLYAADSELIDVATRVDDAMVHAELIEPVSRFSLALAEQLAQAKHLSSDAHWGNAGFCIDAAVYDAKRGEDTQSLGVLCDFARYPNTPDPVSWEVYRLGIFEWQGWETHRVWSPHFFRDPQRVVNAIEQQAAAISQPEEA